MQTISGVPVLGVVEPGARVAAAASRTGRTRTAPAPDAAATLHAVLASCQRWDHGLYAAWRDVAFSASRLS